MEIFRVRGGHSRACGQREGSEHGHRQLSTRTITPIAGRSEEYIDDEDSN